VSAGFASVLALGLLLAALGAARWSRPWLALTLPGTLALLVAGLLALGAGERWEWRGRFALGGEPVHLRLDALNGVFLVLLALIGGAGALHASESWSEREQPASARRGRAWWSMTVLCTALVLLCSNGLHFLIAWEGFAVSAYFLSTLERERAAVASAGWLFLAASRLGTLALIAFFALLAARTGSFDLGPLRERADLAPLFWLALIGFGLKAGLFPLHVWVPSTYAQAPSHVSALLAGVVGKMGLYGLVRFSGWLPFPERGAWTVLALGVLGAVLGAACALAQSDLKRLIAYASVENVGVILIGLGGGMLGAGSTWGQVAMAGALLHVWNDGLAKSLLFLGSGALARAGRSVELSRLGGLWRALPWTAGLFALGCVALCALPPLNGFVSEWLITLGLLQSAAGREGAAAVTVPALIGLALSGALVLATFLKAVSVAFLGAARAPRSMAGAREGGWRLRAPMIALGLGCVLIAGAPVAAWELVAPALEQWNPPWAGLEPPASLVTLGGIQVALALSLAAGALALFARVRSRGARRALTWDCGYAAPSPRMQLSSGSLGATAASWFRWLLEPERRCARPRGLFPRHAHFSERVPEPVLERALARPVALVLAASEWARRRQHGKLQDYILYLVLGLLAVSAVILAGSPA